MKEYFLTKVDLKHFGYIPQRVLGGDHYSTDPMKRTSNLDSQTERVSTTAMLNSPAELYLRCNTISLSLDSSTDLTKPLAVFPTCTNSESFRDHE